MTFLILKLVRVGKVRQNDTGNTSEYSQAYTGDDSGLRLLFTTLTGDFHLWLDRPNIRFAILVD